MKTKRSDIAAELRHRQMNALDFGDPSEGTREAIASLGLFLLRADAEKRIEVWISETARYQVRLVHASDGDWWQVEWAGRPRARRAR